MNGRRVALRLFLRSFLVQGSWNPRTMLGAGMAWAMAPVLKELPPASDAEDRGARAAEHFNAHPYLAGLAMGAMVRLELDGEAPDVIRRFRDALRGPLGALGDQLFWAAVRPAAILLALALAVGGLPPWAVVAIFLLSYNGPHLIVRGWGVHVGLSLGRQVGDAIARADLAAVARRVVVSGALIMGLLSGALFALAIRPEAGVGGEAWRLALPAALLFLWGWHRGSAIRRWVPWIGVIAVLGLLLLGPPPPAS